MSIEKRTRKSAEDRKSEIVSAAIRLAAEIGPDRVTTQQIADAVGLTQPAIFRHFPTKADIWLAVGQHISSAPDGQGEAADDTVGELRKLIVRQLVFISETPAVTAILFSRELHAENEQLRVHFATMMSNRRARFSKLIRAGIESGLLRAEIDAEDAAATLLAAIQGLAMRWSLEKRAFDLVVEGKRILFGLIDLWQPRSD